MQMNMDYRLYQEITQLGKKGDKCTFLMRGADGRIAVCKEIDSRLIPVYHKLQEAKVPGVAEIYGFFIHCGSEAVMMEYIPAITLEEKLLQAGTLSIKETRAIALQICQVLFCLEQLGIVHRDLNPANILIVPDGRVVVTDFGISRMVKSGKDRDTTILGTVGYTAPEQFGFAQTDTRADIYSLGVLVNRMLTGKLPQEILYRGDVRMSSMIEGCTRISYQKSCSYDTGSRGVWVYDVYVFDEFACSGIGRLAVCRKDCRLSGQYHRDRLACGRI